MAVFCNIPVPNFKIYVLQCLVIKNCCLTPPLLRLPLFYTCWFESPSAFFGVAKGSTLAWLVCSCVILAKHAFWCICEPIKGCHLTSTMFTTRVRHLLPWNILKSAWATWLEDYSVIGLISLIGPYLDLGLWDLNGTLMSAIFCVGFNFQTVLLAESGNKKEGPR